MRTIKVPSSVSKAFRINLCGIGSGEVDSKVQKAYDDMTKLLDKFSDDLNTAEGRMKGTALKSIKTARDQYMKDKYFEIRRDLDGIQNSVSSLLDWIASAPNEKIVR